MTKTQKVTVLMTFGFLFCLAGAILMAIGAPTGGRLANGGAFASGLLMLLFGFFLGSGATTIMTAPNE